MNATLDQAIRPAPAHVSKFERRAMGSPLRLTVTGVPAASALVAWGSASDEFERAEQAMSRFRESSDLTRLNRAAGSPGPVEVAPRLRRALAAAWRAHRVTDGRFEPRVLGDLERLGYRGVPVDLPLSRAAWSRWLIVEGRFPCVAVEAPVDLGGIGKGLALRWARRRLRSRLAAHPDAGVLLEAGGDIVADGAGADGGPWLIGIEDPLDRAAERPDDPVGAVNVAVVAVAGGAICTSSVAVHRWRDPAGRSVHHLVDPRTGEPGGVGLLCVTVAGPDPAWAEVWSKTLFLEGARGVGPAARHHGLAAWWVTETGDLGMTSAARLQTVWTR